VVFDCGAELSALCDLLTHTLRRSASSERALKTSAELHSEVTRSAVRVASLLTPQLVSGFNLPPPSTSASASTAAASELPPHIRSLQALQSALTALPPALSAPLVLSRQWSQDPPLTSQHNS
jgi:hypothetical protein